MLLANWQDNYIYTYKIWFQMFHFRKLDNMSRSRELDSQDDNPNRHATS